MAYPTDNEVIPQADAGNKLSNMHTSISHVAGTNKLIDKLHAVAAKLGIGASTPGNQQVLTTDGSGNSLWAKITSGLFQANAVDSTALASHASTDASRAVTTNHIRDLAVTATKLANGAATGVALGSDVVVTTNGAQTIGTGKTLTSPTINTPTIVTPSISNPTLTGTLTATGLISDAHISASAAIAVAKLADGTARQILAMNTAADTPTWTSMTFGTTLYVAASDATAAEKSLAHYICDGTDDQSEINSAVAALPSTGGKIVLSSGTFTIGSATININKAYTLLEGSGYSTRLKFSSGYLTSRTLLTLNAAYSGVRNLAIDGNKTNNVGAAGHLLLNVGSVAYPIVEDVHISESAVYGVFTGSNVHGGRFKNVTITTCNNLGWAADGCITTKIPNHYINCSAISNAAEGFSISGELNIFVNCVGYGNVTNYSLSGNKPGNQFIGCKSYLGNTGFFATSSATRNQFVGCYSTDDGTGYYLAGGANKNLISGCFSYSASAYGYLIGGANTNNNHIVGCYSISDNYGICQLDSNHYNSIDSNHIEDCVGNGIYLGGGTHHSVKGNTVINASVGSGSFNGIIVVGSDYNTIMNNVVRKGTGVSPYGIHIFSGSYNLVGPNDLTLAGATASINDAGTATRKTVMIAQSVAVSSSSLAEVTANTLTDITDMSITIVSGGGDIEVELCGLLTNNTADTYSAIGFSLNGADTVDMAAFTPKTAGHYGNASCFYRWNNTTLGTSYTIKAKFRTQTASTTKAQMYGRSMKVRELRNY